MSHHLHLKSLLGSIMNVVIFVAKHHVFKSRIKIIEMVFQRMSLAVMYKLFIGLLKKF